MQPETRFYQAAGASRPVVRWSPDLKVMFARGCVVDQVAEVDPQTGVDDTLRLAMRAGKELGLEPETAIESFWRTMVVNQVPPLSDGDTESIYPAPAAFGAMFRTWMAASGSTMFTQKDYPRDETAEYHFERASSWGGQKLFKFFVTASGKFGLGQSFLERADRICLLSGGDVFFVLRPEADHHVFIGCAYVHGAMNGELAHLLDDDARSVELELQ